MKEKKKKRDLEKEIFSQKVINEHHPKLILSELALTGISYDISTNASSYSKYTSLDDYHQYKKNRKENNAFKKNPPLFEDEFGRVTEEEKKKAHIICFSEPNRCFDTNVYNELRVQPLNSTYSAGEYYRLKRGLRSNRYLLYLTYCSKVIPKVYPHSDNFSALKYFFSRNLHTFKNKGSNFLCDFLVSANRVDSDNLRNYLRQYVLFSHSKSLITKNFNSKKVFFVKHHVNSSNPILNKAIKEWEQSGTHLLGLSTSTDEVGKVEPSERYKEVLYSVLFKRYNRNNYDIALTWDRSILRVDIRQGSLIPEKVIKSMSIRSCEKIDITLKREKCEMYVPIPNLSRFTKTFSGQIRDVSDVDMWTAFLHRYYMNRVNVFALSRFHVGNIKKGMAYRKIHLRVERENRERILELKRLEKKARYLKRKKNSRKHTGSKRSDEILHRFLNRLPLSEEKKEEKNQIKKKVKSDEAWEFLLSDEEKQQIEREKQLRKLDKLIKRVLLAVRQEGRNRYSDETDISSKTIRRSPNPLTTIPSTSQYKGKPQSPFTLRTEKEKDLSDKLTPIKMNPMEVPFSHIKQLQATNVISNVLTLKRRQPANVALPLQTSNATRVCLHSLHSHMLSSRYLDGLPNYRSKYESYLVDRDTSLVCHQFALGMLIRQLNERRALFPVGYSKKKKKKMDGLIKDLSHKDKGFRLALSRRKGIKPKLISNMHYRLMPISGRVIFNTTVGLDTAFKHFKYLVLKRLVIKSIKKALNCKYTRKRSLINKYMHKVSYIYRYYELGSIWGSAVSLIKIANRFAILKKNNIDTTNKVLQPSYRLRPITKIRHNTEKYGTGFLEKEFFINNYVNVRIICQTKKKYQHHIGGYMYALHRLLIEKSKHLIGYAQPEDASDFSTLGMLSFRSNQKRSIGDMLLLDIYTNEIRNTHTIQSALSYSRRISNIKHNSMLSSILGDLNIKQKSLPSNKMGFVGHLSTFIGSDWSRLIFGNTNAHILGEYTKHFIKYSNLLRSQFEKIIIYYVTIHDISMFTKSIPENLYNENTTIY